jgi:hypothetical protein
MCGTNVHVSKSSFPRSRCAPRCCKSFLVHSIGEKWRKTYLLSWWAQVHSANVVHSVSLQSICEDKKQLSQTRCIPGCCKSLSIPFSEYQLPPFCLWVCVAVCGGAVVCAETSYWPHTSPLCCLYCHLREIPSSQLRMYLCFCVCFLCRWMSPLPPPLLLLACVYLLFLPITYIVLCAIKRTYMICSPFSLPPFPVSVCVSWCIFCVTVTTF